MQISIEFILQLFFLSSLLSTNNNKTNKWNEMPFEGTVVSKMWWKKSIEMLRRKYITNKMLF